MATRRCLSLEDRLAILRERAKGVSHKALAAKFGVTERAIYYTLRTEKERRRDSSLRSKVITVAVTPEEAQAFDALLGRHGVGSRSEGLRRLIQAANGVFAPDEDLAAELAGFRAALNRVGNNVTQIAKRMNEANLSGLRPPFGQASVSEMRSLAGIVLDFADQVHLLAQRRTEAMSLTIDKTLKEFADGSE